MMPASSPGVENAGRKQPYNAWPVPARRRETPRAGCPARPVDARPGTPAQPDAQARPARPGPVPPARPLIKRRRAE